MKSTFRLSMDWLHTWTGIVGGWLLFAMFLTGSAAMFRNEITVWMTPERVPPAGTERALEVAEARLRSVAPRAARWTIVLPNEREPSVQIQWRTNDEAGLTARTALTAPLPGREVLDPSAGTPQTLRRTRGGDLFYYFHHRLDFPTSSPGWAITGSAAVIMLVCLVSGVIIHRRIFKDFFTFRPKAGLRLSWLDAHTVTGVLALPFHLMITYTGVAPMLITVMAPPIMANYSGSRSLAQTFDDYAVVRRAFQDDRRLASMHVAPSGIDAPLRPLREFATRASQYWSGGRAGLVAVSNPGDARAVVEVERHFDGQLAYQPEKLFFDGRSGQMLGSSAPQGAAWTTFSVMWGLHEGRFAGTGLRWVYFVLGLLSSAMIAIGLVFWTIRRRPRQAAGATVPWGHQFVERVNVGVVVGLPIAMASFFWANRLLPDDMVQRDLVESRIFYIVWGALLVTAALRPPRRAWCEAMTVAAVAFGAVPLVNALTTDRSLITAMARGDSITAGFDATMLAVAVMFGVVARKLATRDATRLQPGMTELAAVTPRGAP